MVFCTIKQVFFKLSHRHKFFPDFSGSLIRRITKIHILHCIVNLINHIVFRCFDNFCFVFFFFFLHFYVIMYVHLYLLFLSLFCLWHLFYCAGTTVEREIRSGIETTTTHATITLPPNVEVSKRHWILQLIGVGRCLDFNLLLML